MVEQHRAATRPRPEQDAGTGLAPARVGGAPHEIVRIEVLTRPRGDTPAIERPGGMGHAFRHAGGARGVVDDGGVVEPRVRWLGVFGLSGEGVVECRPLWPAADGEPRLEPLRARELADALAAGDRRHCAGMAHAIRHVFLGQHVDAGNRNRAHLEAAHHRDLPLRQPGQHHDDPVAALHTLAHQPVRQLVREAADVAEAETPLGARFVAPDEREFLRLVARDRIDDVATEIESGRQVPLEGPASVLVPRRCNVHLALLQRVRRRPH